MKEQFDTWHPVVQLLFFLFVIGISVFVRNPVILGISFIAAAVTGYSFKKTHFTRTLVCIYIPVILAAMFFNPLFSHEGATILGYFPDGNPLTLESVLYGLYNGMLIGTVCLWFYSFNTVMNSERILYLTGCLFPSAALVLSMVLKFIPDMKLQIRRISQAFRSLGFYGGGLLKKLRFSVAVLSVMITWAFENSIDKSDSMRARGYGLKGRTRYTTFSWKREDTLRLLILAAFSAVVFAGIFSESLETFFYPVFFMKKQSIMSVLSFVFFTSACFMPVIYNLTEAYRWKYLIYRN